MNMHVRALGWLAALVLCVGNAHATLREVDPGETPTLGSGEGLLLVSVDSDSTLGGLRIQRAGALSATLLKDIKPGLRVQLYVASAGDYYFDHLSTGASGRMQYKLADDSQLHFEVKAGAVNYPGDVLFRSASWRRASISSVNHGIKAMDWLAATFPALRALPFRYAGTYPDPFPAFYAAQAQGHDVDAARTAASVAPEKDAVDVEPLWRPGRIHSVRINGGGDLVAELVKDDNVWSVDLVDLKHASATRLIKTEADITLMEWKGDRTLMIGAKIDQGGDSVRAVMIGDVGAGPLHAKMAELPRRGYVVDMLRSDPGAVLFGSRGPDGQVLVHRVDVSSEASIRATDFSEPRRVNKGVDDGLNWFADASGRLRAAIAVRAGRQVLLYGSEGAFREVKLPDEQGALRPIALSPDGGTIYALWDGDRAQRDLVAFDPVSATIGATLFSRPGVDTEALLLDNRRKLIGAMFYRDGTIASEYFEADRKQLNERVAHAFPGESVVVVDHDEAAQHLILRVDSATRPTGYFHLDAQRNQASLLDESHPWLSGRSWAPAYAVHANGSDGLPIEAYLTLPPGAAATPRPLVVLTHGGPIGVRDAIMFDPEVQLVAGLGYAVLQVNFRGSEGYGRAFRDAGKGQYGSLIEDDIEAALKAVLAANPLDEHRICAMGSSYGGYSSLISAIRRPERYRCVISFFGPTDWLLLFTASDAARTPQGRKLLALKMGDPVKDPTALTAISPLYRYAELKAPLLLIYGDLDVRVDAEHARRLERMLRLAGRPPTTIELTDAGHGLTTPEQRAKVWPAVTHFLKQNLGEP